MYRSGREQLAHGCNTHELLPLEQIHIGLCSSGLCQVFDFRFSGSTSMWNLLVCSRVIDQNNVVFECCIFVAKLQISQEMSKH